MFTTPTIAVLLASLSSAVSFAILPRAQCDASTLNKTVGSYIVGEYDTIFTVATKTKRGVCDIARANLMADATLVYAGENLTIPAQVCHPDSSTCLLVNTHPTRDCIFGGPHTYTTFINDTIASIAQTKFNITVESLWNTSSRMLPTGTTPESILAVGNNIKLPQCSPSECEIEPYTLLYGTYKDLAEKLDGVTVGQIMAFNPTYNHSSPAAGEGPLLTIPVKCKLLSANYTVVS